MEVTSITNGVIIDHVPAGTALTVLQYLGVDPAETRLALIMNADSNAYGRKDIIKIEQEGAGGDGGIDLDVLGFVARQATVNIVRGGNIISKGRPAMPLHLVGVLSCANPRCVSTSEPGIEQRFYLSSAERGEYRCDYCDEEAKR